MTANIPMLLVVYATVEGQARKVAMDIAAVSLQNGLPTACVSADALPGAAALERYTGILLVASIHRGRHQQEAYDFVQGHGDLLKRKVTGLVSVSLSAAGDETDRAEATRCANDFLAEVGWIPQEVRLIGGAFRFSEYGFFTRLVMRMIAGSKGLPMDGKDRELTDWQDVANFAKSFVEKLGHAARLDAA